MRVEIDLWQKSLDLVTEITGISALDCDVCHEPAYIAALRFFPAMSTV